MSLIILRNHTIPAAMSLLPQAMDGQGWRSLLAAIALAESGMSERMPESGDGVGWFRLIPAHIEALTKAPDIAPVLKGFIAACGYAGANAKALAKAVADNDVLACGLARLLLESVSSTPDGDGSEPYDRQSIAAAAEIWAGLWRDGKMPETEADVLAWRHAWARGWGEA